MKILPSKLIQVLSLILILSASLTLFNIIVTEAKLSPEEKEKFSHVSAVFKKLELESVGGKKVKISQIKAPVVIINFWASWCLPCLEEFPSLVNLKSKYIDDEFLRVFAINNDDENNAKNSDKISKKFHFNFEVIRDPSGKMIESFGFSALPVSIIFIEGEVFKIGMGKTDFESSEIIDAIEKVKKKL